MKICILTDRIPPESGGGAERVAWEEALALAKRGHTVSLITTTERPLKEVEEKTIEGVRIFYIHSSYPERLRAWRSLYNPSTVGRVKRILQELRPDVVHSHQIHYHLSYHTLRLAKKAGAKVFLTAHDVMSFHYGKLVEFIDPKNLECKKEWNYRVAPVQQMRRFKRWYNPFRNGIIRRYIKNLDGFFAVSDALREALVQNGMPNATVLHNGIDAAEWSASVEAVQTFQEKFKLEGRHVIFFGGRLNRLKGGTVMLECLREVVKKVPSALLLVAGTRDAYLELLIKQAHQWGIGQNIACTGWLEGSDLRAAYHAAEVVVVPSICFDSFPTMNLEAMACAKPMVATCFGGSREAVEDGITGYIVNPFDTHTMSEKIIELLQDSDKNKRFGQAGHERVIKEFSLSKQMTNYERIFKS